MRNILFALFFFALVCRPLSAQMQASVGTAEIPVHENDAPFQLITLGRTGVLVVMEQNDLYSVKPQRSLYFYDENLHKRWQTDMEMESRFRYAGHAIEQDSIRFALLATDKRESPEFLELAVCIADGRYRFKTHAIKADFLSKAEFAEFKITKNRWHFLVLQKNEYVYCVADTRTDTLYNVSIASAKDYTCCDWQLDADGNASFVFRDAKIVETGLFFKTVSPFGEEMAQAVIPSPRNDIRFVDARMAVLGNHDFLIGGSWNMSRSKQTVSTYDFGSETMGMFAMRYQNGNIRKFWMKGYLEYPDIDTLLGTEENYRFNQARQKSNGRLVMPDYLSLLRMEPAKGKFRLTGEIYERVITTTTEVSYDFYGRMMPYTRVTFDGYRYRNAFYSEFDSTAGNLRNSVFDMEHPQLYERLQPLSVVSENAFSDLLYAYNNQSVIVYRVTRGQSGIEPLKRFGLTSLFAGDRLQRTWNDALAEWFPGCMIAYGYRQIANTRRKGKSRQSVFYMNKVVAETKQ